MKVDVDAAVEDTRDIFEEEVFKKYFIGSIKKILKLVGSAR